MEPILLLVPDEVPCLCILGGKPNHHCVLWCNYGDSFTSATHMVVLVGFQTVHNLLPNTSYEINYSEINSLRTNPTRSTPVTSTFREFNSHWNCRILCAEESSPGISFRGSWSLGHKWRQRRDPLVHSITGDTSWLQSEASWFAPVGISISIYCHNNYRPLAQAGIHDIIVLASSKQKQV